MRTHSEPVWPAALRAGLIGGAIAVLMALIGMVEAFGTRPIIAGVVPMGHALLGLAIFYSAYSAARLAYPAGGDTARTATGAVLSAGGLAGAIAGGLLAALLLLGEWVNLRDILINASPGLFSVLAFRQGPYLGAVLLVVFGAALGLAAGAALLLRPALRRAVFVTVLVVMLTGLLADEVRLTIAQYPLLDNSLYWMFSGKGLSIIGALAVAAITVTLIVLRGRRARAAVGAAARPPLPRWVAPAVGLGLLIVLVPLLGDRHGEALNQIGLFLLMGLGLNIVVGFAGLLDLGYVAFFALGAYTVGILTSPEVQLRALEWWPAFLTWWPAGISWWAALPFAILVATLAGVLLGIPVLKMRGDYLAIVTLGFGEIIRYLALSDWLRTQLDIGGAQGIAAIAKPQIGGFAFNSPVKLFYIILAGCLLVGFVAWRLRDSRLGRAWMAVREDEDVAQAIGINLVATKLLAFATGAAFSGLSGAIFAGKLGSIYPHSFTLLYSIYVLALIIIGGMGSIPGVVVGAAVLIGLPEYLREFADYRMLVYGALLVAMMLFRPEGLWPEEAHTRELRVDENAAAGEAVTQALSESPLEPQPAPKGR